MPMGTPRGAQQALRLWVGGDRQQYSEGRTGLAGTGLLPLFSHAPKRLCRLRGWCEPLGPLSPLCACQALQSCWSRAQHSNKVSHSHLLCCLCPQP